MSEASEAPVQLVTPPIPRVGFERSVHPAVRWLLRSRLHGLLGDSPAAITVTGRRSGRTYSTPVGYEQRGETVCLTSRTDRTWWRNLLGGADVSVRLRGEERTGHATVTEDDDEVAGYVHDYLERHGLGAASRLARSVEAETRPDEDALASGLDEVVVVRIDLDG